MAEVTITTPGMRSQDGKPTRELLNNLFGVNGDQWGQKRYEIAAKAFDDAMRPPPPKPRHRPQDVDLLIALRNFGRSLK